MALSSEQLDALRRAAVAEGVDPNELIAAAESGESDDEPEAAAAEPTLKPFLWNSWFMRVREIRAMLGITERAEDDEMFAAPWLEKHGPKTPAASPNSPDAPTE